MQLRKSIGDVGVMYSKEGDGQDQDGKAVPAPTKCPHLVGDEAKRREDGVRVEMEGGVIVSSGMFDRHGAKWAII